MAVALPANELHQPVQVETEVMLSQTHVEEVTSTFVHGNYFAALHTHPLCDGESGGIVRGVASDSHFGVAQRRQLTKGAVIYVYIIGVSAYATTKSISIAMSSVLACQRLSHKV